MLLIIEGNKGKPNIDCVFFNDFGMIYSNQGVQNNNIQKNNILYTLVATVNCPVCDQHLSVNSNSQQAISILI